ncbi:MAG: hypothetical protein AAF598_17540 [Bacteroidota bacterium]
MLTRWKHQAVCPEKVQQLSKELGLSPYLSSLLLQRGINNSEEAQPFLDPQIDHLHQAEQLQGITLLARQLDQARQQKEQIQLVINQSIDALASASIFQQILLAGQIPFQVQFSSDTDNTSENWSIYIGFQAPEGEPANPKNWWISPCFEPSDHQQKIRILSAKGTSEYPYQELSATGLAYKLADHLAEARAWPIEPNAMLELVALSCTVGEYPMTGENRIMTFLGMQKIKSKPGPFFQELKRLKLLNQTINSKTLQFKVGSFLQEMLQTDQSREILNWLQGKDLEQIEALLKMIKLGRKAQVEGIQTVFKEAERMVLQRHSRSTHCIVLYRPQWPKACLRKAAFKLADRFGRPCLLATQTKDQQIYGILKSNTDLELTRALTGIFHQFKSWIPGPSSSAFITQKSDLQRIANQLDQFMENEIGPQLKTQEIQINLPIKFKDITPALMEELNQLAPFGRGNKQPIFQTQGVREIEESTTLGNHLRVTLKQGRAPARPGIGFGLAEYQRKIRKKAFDICFTIHENQANGKEELQLNIKDIKLRK